jgi:hypothetical protein
MLRDDEREAWRGFLAAEPEFAGDSIGSAVDGPDPPDVLCVTISGKKIGVELTKWAEHEQLTSGKARESPITQDLVELDGLCDKSQLTPAEAKIVAKIAREQNLVNCQTGVGSCDSSLLTSDQRTEVTRYNTRKIC